MVVCPCCEGIGTGHVTSPNGVKTVKCRVCRGTGSVMAIDAERYRQSRASADPERADYERGL